MDEETSFAWIDLQQLMLMGVILVIVIAMRLMNPPHPKVEDAPPGAMVIELRWPLTQDDDVDLWVLAPGGTPVGYSAKTGHGIALLRDDLGQSADPDSLNDEIAQANVLRPGIYVANAHLYRARTAPPIHIKLSIKIRRGNQLFTIAHVEADLTAQGEELTLIRFTLDAQGNIVPGSINDLPIQLRSQP